MTETQNANTELAMQNAATWRAQHLANSQEWYRRYLAAKDDVSVEPLTILAMAKREAELANADFDRDVIRVEQNKIVEPRMDDRKVGQ